MLVADRDGLRVRQAAGEVERRLGVADFEARALPALLGKSLTARIAALVQSGGNGSFIGQLTTTSGELLDVSAHLSGAYVVVELEPAQAATLPASLVLDRLEVASSGFEGAATVLALCDRAAKEFRELTGFDRVMVYQFLDDDVGRVVAEDRRDNLRSFLNHHFPGTESRVRPAPSTCAIYPVSYARYLCSIAAIAASGRHSRPARHERQQPAQRGANSSAIPPQYGSPGLGLDFHRERRPVVGPDRLPSRHAAADDLGCPRHLPRPGRCAGAADQGQGGGDELPSAHSAARSRG